MGQCESCTSNALSRRVGQGWSTASWCGEACGGQQVPTPRARIPHGSHCVIPKSLCARAERQGWACGLAAMAALPLPRLHITDASLAASRDGSLALPLEAGLQASGLGNSRGSPCPGVEAVYRGWRPDSNGRMNACVQSPASYLCLAPPPFQHRHPPPLTRAGCQPQLPAS